MVGNFHPLVDVNVGCRSTAVGGTARGIVVAIGISNSAAS